MDLLVDNSDYPYKLSELGIVVRDVKSSGISLNHTRNDINYRNGKLYYGSNLTERIIVVTGSYYALDEYEDQVMQDKLNGLLSYEEPFYISRMYSVESMYGYERPGERYATDFVNAINQRVYHYRWKVLLSEPIDYDFQGKSGAGLLTNITITFVTADLPYGISTPQDIDLTGQKYLRYEGSAECSQLEWPFSIVLTSNADQRGEFSLMIGNQEFEYEGKNIIKKNDVFELKGTSFLLNGLNINDMTNIKSFVLTPSANRMLSFYTDFQGSVIAKNIVNLYL